MLKIGIVGCGKIADSHAAQIQHIPGCVIVGACDREELMARQLRERFPVEQHYHSIESLISEARPDVLHITTPPESHFELARLGLQQGCHVYVEKPFTLRTSEAETLIALAEARRLKLTVGHDDQFRPAARRLRQLVGTGYLGGDAVHLESHYCYELGETSAYARALLADKTHWVRRLPGQLLHNIISHGIARISEFITDDDPEVIAHGRVSPLLQRLGESEIIDELRVIIASRQGATAYFTFSSQMRPGIHQFRIFGPRNGVVLDQDCEVLLRLPGSHAKSYLAHFVPPLSLARQYLANWATNAGLFLRNDFHMKAGMKFLIRAFYQSITDDGPPPIPYREILRTSRIMDSIFQQLPAPSSRESAGKVTEELAPQQR